MLLITLDNISANPAHLAAFMAEPHHRRQTTETLTKLYDGKLRLERRCTAPGSLDTHLC